MFKKAKKFGRILIKPGLWRYARHGVAPTVEHLQPMSNLQIAMCIDVGANIGQFSAVIAYLYPDAVIVAFEPIPEACIKYRRSLKQSRATVLETSIGRHSGSAVLHLTNRLDSSSLLRPGNAPKLAFGIYATKSLVVSVKSLGDIISSSDIRRPCLMKIDVQGSELDVIDGAKNILNYVDYIYVELSYLQLYEGQPLANDILNRLFQAGYVLKGVYNQVTTSEFGAMQADFLLVRPVR